MLVLEGDLLQGIVTPYEMGKLPQERWENSFVEDIMIPLAQLRWVGPEHNILRILENMDREEIHHVPVVRQGNLLGVLGRHEIYARLRPKSKGHPIENLNRLLLKRLSSILLLFVVSFALSPLWADGYVDYQHRLNPHFQKVARKETRYIIVHSTESRLPSALRTLSRGKIRHGRYITHGGHAHFLVARSGTVYRISRFQVLGESCRREHVGRV